MVPQRYKGYRHVLLLDVVPLREYRHGSSEIQSIACVASRRGTIKRV